MFQICKNYRNILVKIKIIATIKIKTFDFREYNVLEISTFNSEIFNVDDNVLCILPNNVVNICDLCNIIHNHDSYLLYLFEILFLK